MDLICTSMTQKDIRRFKISTGPDTTGEVVIEFIDQKFSICILPALNWKERSLEWFSFHEAVSKTIKNIQAEYLTGDKSIMKMFKNQPQFVEQ